MTPRKYIVATPQRSVCDDHARVLSRMGRLRFLALATRRGIVGVPPEETALNPTLGLALYVGAKALPGFRGESFRFACHPWFDKWALARIKPGDGVISSYGYANACFRFARQTGGVTLLDGGNSHPENFWNILSEEHERWGCRVPPVAHHHHRRSMEMMSDVDFVLSPSRFVSESFLTRGFSESQILPNIYPINLSDFSPSRSARPENRPFTLISTGSLSLRKGSPYLLEAFRLIRKRVPNARLLLTDAVADSVQPIFEKNKDLPIEWSPSLAHPQLAERLRSADVFVLPSLEDGFARTVTEALACGLPVVTTPNTGARDALIEGLSGTVVPIRDPAAIATAALAWWDKIRSGKRDQCESFIDPTKFTFDAFATQFAGQVRGIGDERLKIEDWEMGRKVGR